MQSGLCWPHATPSARRAPLRRRGGRDAEPRVPRTGVPWIELRSTAEDWKAADPELLHGDARRAPPHPGLRGDGARTRRRGLVHGPAHSSIGQEGGAVGSIIGLRSTDGVNGSHRGHHQFLAKALTHVTGGRFDARRARHAGGAGGAAAHPRRDPRPGSGLLPRARRVDAPAVARGRRPRHQRHRRRRRARWRPATPGRRSTRGTTDVTLTYFGDGAVPTSARCSRR